MSLRDEITRALTSARNDVEAALKWTKSMDSMALRTVLHKVLPRKVQPYVSVSPHSQSVHVTVYMHNLSGFKSAKLVRLLAALEDEGFACTHTSDYTFSTPNRDFSFRKECDGLTITITSCAAPVEWCTTFMSIKRRCNSKAMLKVLRCTALALCSQVNVLNARICLRKRNTHNNYKKETSWPD